jgi:hypothetical protein
LPVDGKKYLGKRKKRTILGMTKGVGKLLSVIALISTSDAVKNAEPEQVHTVYSGELVLVFCG